MKNSLNLLLFFSLIYFIYSCASGKVKVAEGKDGAEVCATPIPDCTTYDPTSAEDAAKCAVCSLPKAPATDKLTCEACASGKETKDGKACYTTITDCDEYATDGKCAVCALPKVPASTDGLTCVACPDGKETKDGKVCYTKITDCAEYATDGKCTKCTGKIPKSDGTACEACPDGKETKDGKTCVDKTTSFSSFIKISTFALLYLLNIF